MRIFTGTLVLLLWCFHLASGQDTLHIRPGFGSSELYPYTLFRTGGVPWQQMTRGAFDESGKPKWFRSRLQNTGTTPMQLMVICKAVDTLSGSIAFSGGQVRPLALTGTHRPVRLREYPSNYLTYSFLLPPGQTATLSLRAVTDNYRFTLAPYAVFERVAGIKYLYDQQLYQGLYVGGMFLIVLFGVAMMALFREKLYVFYASCVIWSLALMLVQNEYYYYVFDWIPKFFISKDVYGVIVTAISISYFFFTTEFLNTRPKDDRILLWIGKISSGVLAVLLVACLLLDYRLFAVRGVFYPFLSSLYVIIIWLWVKSVRRGYKPSYLFAVASIPVITVGLLETMLDLHHIPVAVIYNTYYLVTLWEMFLLTMSIAYRFYREREAAAIVRQQQYEAEIRARDEERERIARDLHDKMGALLSAAKINVGLIGRSPDSQLVEQTEQMLLLAVEETRNAAHNLYPANLLQLGLVPTIRDLYGRVQAPKFTVDAIGMDDERLERPVEVALYSIIQEAVQNIFKHAEAREVTIQLIREKKNLTLLIEDNGRGFVPSFTRGRGMGLENMARRVEILKGQLEVDSMPGRGTIILVRIKGGK
ncbi:MAG: hypothetical protein J7576_16700 [Siphonobacter aquaeclarae]|jgi:signal transduction histidine kinase|nr:hypothetical protein [Siphonobacter aquaeclarae]